MFGARRGREVVEKRFQLDLDIGPALDVREDIGKRDGLEFFVEGEAEGLAPQPEESEFGFGAFGCDGTEGSENASRRVVLEDAAHAGREVEPACRGLWPSWTPARRLG